MSSSTPRRPPPAPTLYLLRGEKPGMAVEIDRDVTLIGRLSSCDVVLSKRSISRQHARIIREGGAYYLEDLESDSGTKVDGVRVTGRVALRDGSLIEIRSNLFTFVNPSFRIDDDDSSSRILNVLDLSGSSLGLGQAVGPEDKLRYVLEISRNLGDTLHLESVLKKVLTALFEIFPQADRGFVVLKEDGVLEAAPRSFKFKGDKPGDFTISRTVLNHVMEQRQAILSTDLINDSRFNGNTSVLKSQVRTMMCVPLFDQDHRPTGILQIDTRNDRCRFSEDDLDLLAAVAVLVGVAVENSRLHSALIYQTQTEQETADAREVQKALLPSLRPEIEGYAFWDYYEPARSVGGDYFDYLPLAPSGKRAQRWVIALGDVVGKGMSAALIMARLSVEVRFHVLSGLDPASVVARLNDNLASTGVDNRFITFLLVLIDGESHRMTVVGAGHMGPVIHRASGSIEIFGEELMGLPLGIEPDREYQAAETTLGPGDRVVLYTDGVTDAIDAAGQSLLLHRLKQAILEAPAPIDQLGESIMRGVRRHCGDHPPIDDITLLCFGRT